MNESEFQAAFEQRKDAVYRFAWRMTNSPGAAEDITQDVFLALLPERARFDATRGGMRPFLLGIARNLVLKALRRDKDRWNALDEAQFIAQPVDYAGGEIAEMVGQAVQGVPHLQREALVLAHYEGLSLDEIARRGCRGGHGEIPPASRAGKLKAHADALEGNRRRRTTVWNHSTMTN